MGQISHTDYTNTYTRAYFLNFRMPQKTNDFYSDKIYSREHWLWMSAQKRVLTVIVSIEESTNYEYQYRIEQWLWVSVQKRSPTMNASKEESTEYECQYRREHWLWMLVQKRELVNECQYRGEHWLWISV